MFSKLHPSPGHIARESYPLSYNYAWAGGRNVSTLLGPAHKTSCIGLVKEFFPFFFFFFGPNKLIGQPNRIHSSLFSLVCQPDPVMTWCPTGWQTPNRKEIGPCNWMEISHLHSPIFIHLLVIDQYLHCYYFQFSPTLDHLFIQKHFAHTALGGFGL